MKIIGVVMAVLFLTGCAGSIMATQMMSAEDLTMQRTSTLCAAYGERGRFNKLEKIRYELYRREALTDAEWHHISKRSIYIGMTEMALLCSLGQAEINESVGSWGTHRQWVYSDSPYSMPDLYVYTENGVVTSWQE